MAILSVIRRWYFREGMPIRAIAKRTGLSRNTVKKYLANEAIEPRYRKRKLCSKLDGVSEKLTGWLEEELAKGRKRRRSLKQLHRDLMALGYTGSYDRVCAFARRWRQANGPTSTANGLRFRCSPAPAPMFIHQRRERMIRRFNFLKGGSMLRNHLKAYG